MGAGRMTYVIETRDARERWHRPRGHKYQSFGAAIHAVATLSPNMTGFRIINTDTGRVEYFEPVNPS